MWRSISAIAVIRWLAVLLVCQTVVAVLYSYRDYFPPNFRAGFLIGRGDYFYGPYQWAFYVHILSGPVSLVVGLLLLNTRLRERYPRWHRLLGRLQVGNVLLLVAPSGFWMAWYAATGAVAAAGFATLAIATALCAWCGWRAAVLMRFDHHRRWMLRCFVLLNSAVVLRVIGGASEVFGVDGTYPYAAWLSWLVPLVVLEWATATRPAVRHQQS